jgi:hypothetical protein
MFLALELMCRIGAHVLYWTYVRCGFVLVHVAVNLTEHDGPALYIK